MIDKMIRNVAGQYYEPQPAPVRIEENADKPILLQQEMPKSVSAMTKNEVLPQVPSTAKASSLTNIQQVQPILSDPYTSVLKAKKR